MTIPALAFNRPLQASHYVTIASSVCYHFPVNKWLSVTSTIPKFAHLYFRNRYPFGLDPFGARALLYESFLFRHWARETQQCDDYTNLDTDMEYGLATDMLVYYDRLWESGCTDVYTYTTYNNNLH